MLTERRAIKGGEGIGSEGREREMSGQTLTPYIYRADSYRASPGPVGPQSFRTGFLGLFGPWYFPRRAL